jgi:hypothetical protein
VLSLSIISPRRLLLAYTELTCALAALPDAEFDKALRAEAAAIIEAIGTSADRDRSLKRTLDFPLANDRPRLRKESPDPLLGGWPVDARPYSTKPTPRKQRRPCGFWVLRWCLI